MEKLTCFLLVLQGLSSLIKFTAFAFPLGPNTICPVDTNGLYYGAFPEDFGCCLGNCSSNVDQSLEEEEDSLLELRNQLKQLLLLSNVSEDDEYYVEEESHGSRVHRNRRSTLETYEEDQHTNIQVEKDPQDLSSYVPMCLTTSKYVAPLYATSTTRHKPVQLVQIPKVMEQHIEMKFCQEGASPIYKGFCKQAYKHEKVYIVNPDKDANPAGNQGYSSPQVYFSQDTIYVASGCKALIDTHEVMDQAKKIEEYVKQYQKQYGSSSSSSGEKKTSVDYFRFISSGYGSRPLGRSLDSGEVGQHGFHHGEMAGRHQVKPVRPPFGGAGHVPRGNGKAHEASNQVTTEQRNVTTAVAVRHETSGAKVRSLEGDEELEVIPTSTPNSVELEDPTSTTVEPKTAEQVEDRFGLDDVVVQLGDFLAVDAGEVFDEFSSVVEEEPLVDTESEVETTTVSGPVETTMATGDAVVQLDDFSGAVEVGQVFDESSGAQESFVEVGTEPEEASNSTDTSEGFETKSHEDQLQVQDLVLETTTQVPMTTAVVPIVSEEEVDQTTTSTTEATELQSQPESDPAILKEVDAKNSSEAEQLHPVETDQLKPVEEDVKKTSSEVTDDDKTPMISETSEPVAPNKTSEAVQAPGHVEEKRETVILPEPIPANSTALAIANHPVQAPNGPLDRLQNRHPTGLAPAHHMGNHPGPFGQRSRHGRFPGRPHFGDRFLAGGAGHQGLQQPRFPSGTPVTGEAPRSSRLTHQPTEEAVEAFPEHDRGTRNTGDVESSSRYYEPEASSTRRRVPPKPLEIGVPVFASKEYGNPLKPKLRTSKE